MPFIQTSGTQFTLDGNAFYFAGNNTYYLTYKSKLMVDLVLDSAMSLGSRVIRTWGFLDVGSIDGSVPTIQPPGTKEGVYFHYWNPVSNLPSFNDGPTGLEKLDYVVYAAQQRGLRLILPLINNWPDFGGIDQYVAWYRLHSHNDFYSSPDTRQAYKNWVSHLLNRTNSYSGVAYRDDLTIMAWELVNEPRCSGNGRRLLDWIDEMSAFVKQVDSNHLVAVGDEGFFNRSQGSHWTYDGSSGTDFEAFLEFPMIDFGTFHMYPDQWGLPSAFGSQWIDDHLAAGSRANKPVILEEYGWKDASSRSEVFQSWLEQFYNSDGAGDLFWMLADKQDDGSLYPDFDQYTLYADTAPASIKAHAAQMASRT